MSHSVSTMTGLGLCVLLLPCSITRASMQDEPISVRAQVPARTYYVGQAIELRVGAIGQSERPRFVVPRIAAADVTPLRTDLSPIGSSGIDSIVEERNLFISRFRIVSHRAGSLEVPPVKVFLGARAGASEPIRLRIQSLPEAGRTTDFLGGVGAFQVEAEARPATIRSGQVLEYRVHVFGPGARGITRAPELRRFERVPLGLRIEPMPVEAVDDPPSRIFRYRLRPTRAGKALLPPVAIAGFDPKTAHYVTKVTRTQSIRVVDLPRFNPASLDDRTQIPLATGWSRRAVIGVAAMAFGVLGLIAAGLAWRRAFSEHRAYRDARRLASRALRRLDAKDEPAELARQIAATFADWLHLATGRPGGALTPGEAFEQIEQITGSLELSHRAREVIALCDLARYAGAGASAQTLVDATRPLLVDLKHWKRKKGGVERWEILKHQERQS